MKTRNRFLAIFLLLALTMSLSMMVGARGPKCPECDDGEIIYYYEYGGWHVMYYIDCPRDPNAYDTMYEREVRWYEECNSCDYGPYVSVYSEQKLECGH